jgi:hypothetical protein
MTENPEFPILPKKGIIFLDNCIFSINYENSRSKERGGERIRKLKQSITRLGILEENLRNSDNWCAIQEVLEEFKQWSSHLDYSIRLSKSKKIKRLLEKASIKKWDISKLLNQRDRIANNNNLINRLGSAIHEIALIVEKRFIGRDGKTNFKKTDIKLISLALAYAEQDFSYLFSEDKPLLKTFEDCANKLLLSNAYVISYEFKTPIPAQKYSVTLAKQSEI